MEKDLKFDLNDITLKGCIMSDISSRSEINILENDKLPIFVAPMDTVINHDNYKTFLDLGMNVCIPRQNPNEERQVYSDEAFISYGLNELEDIIKNKESLPKRVLIDVANGHSKRVYDIANDIKQKYDVLLMVGNIANPLTIIEYAKIGVDYIRCSVGSGSCCITACNTALYYPMGSLISECYEIKKKYNLKIKIVADGGFKNFADIIKGLALGADYVMIGSICNKAIESCGEKVIKKKNYNTIEQDEYITIEQDKAIKYFHADEQVYTKYRGMSTKEVQQSWGKKNLKTAEGISFYNTIEYTMSGWVENFSDYLKSCMSYQGFYDIKEFSGNSPYIFITQQAFNRFNK